ncbi:conserved hypothetical protein [Carnobacterium maltaromaticum]|uniref:WxL domain-containing protein n=1 Tax=Carnobacterium maltaromaticum TaxID=2751 RepID=UPI00191BA708|nr:WxL domain-containing protein [Carnobacterium maltaromaticum]CAD5898848.1 conserved hypothetical protein [Carnobacterium maltaromaticum]
MKNKKMAKMFGLLFFVLFCLVSLNEEVLGASIEDYLTELRPDGVIIKGTTFNPDKPVIRPMYQGNNATIFEDIIGPEGYFTGFNSMGSDHNQLYKKGDNLIFKNLGQFQGRKIALKITFQGTQTNRHYGIGISKASGLKINLNNNDGVTYQLVYDEPEYPIIENIYLDLAGLYRVPRIQVYEKRTLNFGVNNLKKVYVNRPNIWDVDKLKLEYSLKNITIDGIKQNVLSSATIVPASLITPQYITNWDTSVITDNNTPSYVIAEGLEGHGTLMHLFRTEGLTPYTPEYLPVRANGEENSEIFEAKYDIGQTMSETYDIYYPDSLKIIIEDTENYFTKLTPKTLQFKDIDGIEITEDFSVKSLSNSKLEVTLSKANLKELKTNQLNIKLAFDELNNAKILNNYDETEKVYKVPLTFYNVRNAKGIDVESEKTVVDARIVPNIYGEAKPSKAYLGSSSTDLKPLDLLKNGLTTIPGDTLKSSIMDTMIFNELKEYQVRVKIESTLNPALTKIITVPVQVEESPKQIFSSELSFNLYANAGTNIGKIKLDFVESERDGTLSFIGKQGSIFHRNYSGEKYIGITILREGAEIFSTSVNGDTQQEDLETQLNKFGVKKNDVLHFHFEEPAKQVVKNIAGGQPSLSSEFSKSFSKDMYYLINQQGFIPVNNAVSIETYSKGIDGLNYIYHHFSTMLVTKMMGYTYNNYSGNITEYDPTAVFHSLLPNGKRHSLEQFEIGADHILSEPKKEAIAYGRTTFGEMNLQLNKLQGANGTIFKVYFPDSNKLKFWRNGVASPLKDTTQRENYIELTEKQGIVQLDFDKIKPKKVTLELGSDPKKNKVTDFTDILNYENVSSTFVKEVKTDKLGTYDQGISIKQNLITNSNYLLSEIVSEVTVVDTTPPTAVGKKNQTLAIYKSLPVNPADLVEEIKDNSDVSSLKFEYIDENGDTSVPGVKKVKIKISDSSGNSTTLSVDLTIVGGGLTIAQVPNFNFDKVKSGETSKTLTQQNSAIEVNDLRGTKMGWKLQASMTDFSLKDGKKLKANLALAKGIPTNEDKNVSGISTSDVTLNAVPQTIMTAKKNTGIKKTTGTFKNENISLINIAPGSRIGSYNATVNWILLDAP